MYLNMLRIHSYTAFPWQTACLFAKSPKLLKEKAKPYSIGTATEYSTGSPEANRNSFRRKKQLVVPSPYLHLPV